MTEANQPKQSKVAHLRSLDSDVTLRKLATYLQYRLDRAGAGDLKISQQIVGHFIVLIEEVVRGRRERRER